MPLRTDLHVPMLPRSSTFATTTTIFLIALSCLHQSVLAQAPPPPPPSHGNSPHIDPGKPPEVICRPYGICEPCPKEELEQPFCQPFGNRRLMHCSTTAVHPPPISAAAGQTHHGGHPHRNSYSHIPPPDHPLDHAGETPAWESCGRIVTHEHADFWEFIACNVLFAITSLALVVVRSRRLHALQTRQLAARIGVTRGATRHG